MTTANANVINNGAKLIGEAVIPGASLLMDGKFGTGVLHTATAVVACSVLGPLAVLAVAANSFASSVTGDSLYVQAKNAVNSMRTPAKGAVEATPAPAPVVPEKK